MGVVGLPSRVTGLAAISISEEITFMPGLKVVQILPNAIARGIVLAFDLDDDGFMICHSRSAFTSTLSF